jgi:hypothetical protein
MDLEAMIEAAGIRGAEGKEESSGCSEATGIGTESGLSRP